jgi:signal transduction histidine kinase
MSPEALAGIGRPFWQADGTVARKHGGVGLGLALTKRLMQLHGGALEVQSTPGAGTLVTLRVPRERIGTRPQIVLGAA